MNAFSMRIKSFQNAWNGIKTSFNSEIHLRIHLLIGLLVTIAAVLLDVPKNEWLMLIFLMGLVIAIELLNTALEELCNFVQPQHHEHIGRIKDISAGAVLVAAVTAAIGGGIIFLPYVVS